MNGYATSAIRIIKGLLTAERPMPSTQKVQVRLDETKAEQNQAVSAKKAHIKGFNPNANITSPKGRESVKNLSRMRQLKLVPVSGDVRTAIFGCQTCHNFRAARHAAIKRCTNKV
jgi:hypothetical protein